MRRQNCPSRDLFRQIGRILAETSRLLGRVGAIAPLIRRPLLAARAFLFDHPQNQIVAVDVAHELHSLAADHPRYADAIPFAKALIEANPEHMVWGTDWPHVALTNNMTNDGDLLNALEDYAPDPDLRHKILVNNPAVLYGF